MAEYVHLVGAEQVQSAAITMRSAAEEMSRATSQITYSLEAHQRFMTDWLVQLDGILRDRTHDLGITLGPLG
jgi:hypothetical protein